MADLPPDIVREILGRVELSIDARVELRKHGAVPKKLVIDEGLKEKLNKILEYRARVWIETEDEDSSLWGEPIEEYRKFIKKGPT